MHNNDGTPVKSGTTVPKKSDRKETPHKTNGEKIDMKSKELHEFHQLSWCAAKDKCTNSLRAATTERKCFACANAVHEECCEKEVTDGDEFMYCLWCLSSASNNSDNNDGTHIKIHHGMDIWCAARDMCKNKSSRTHNNSRCAYCQYQTHDECLDEQYCLWCHELKQLEEQDRKLKDAKQKEALNLTHETNDNMNQSKIIYNEQETEDELAEAFPNDTSIIHNESSFYNNTTTMDISYNSKGNTSELDTTTEREKAIKRNEVDEEMAINIVHRTLDVFTSSNVYTATDAVLQALCNSLGMSIKRESFHVDMAQKYIEQQKIWFTNQNEAIKAMAGNKYKIMAKCLQIPVRHKKLNKEKLQKLREELIVQFISMDTKTLINMGNIQGLSKLNGITFKENTITEKGKKDIITLAIKFCEKGISTLPNSDNFSINILQANLNEQKGPLDTEQVVEVQQTCMDIQEETIQHNTVKSRVSSRESNRRPIARNQKRSSKNLTRVELRLNLQPTVHDKGNVDQLQRQIQEVVNKLIEADDSVQFHPWYENETQKTLENNKVPEDLRSMHQYFPRLQPIKTGPTYGEFQISHKRNWEDIIGDLTPWLTNQKHGLYYQVLQCPLTTNIGWLLWSFRRIDTDRLQREIEELYDIKVNLRYQNISIGQGKTAADNIVRALHVIVNQQHADFVSSKLQQIYSFQADMFPLGIVMRFIPHILRVTKDKTEKIIKWRARQHTYLKAIENQSRPMTATSWEIMLLDTNIKDFGTLRKQVMEIRSKSNQAEHLFLSVDVSFFRSNEVIFSFLPRHEHDARSFVANIVPYFRHKYPIEQIKDVFYHEAIARAEQSVWNADTEEVVSPADLYIDQSREILDDFDLMDAIVGGTTNARLIADHDTREITRVERLFTGEDSTSVGTLFTHENPSTKATIQINQTTMQTHNISSAAKSVSTSMTTEEVERKILTMSTELETIKTMISAVLQNQQNPGNQQSIQQHGIEIRNTNEELLNKADTHTTEDVCRDK
jgi:hypothetical protein